MNRFLLMTAHVGAEPPGLDPAERESSALTGTRTDSSQPIVNKHKSPRLSHASSSWHHFLF